MTAYILSGGWGIFLCLMAKGIYFLNLLATLNGLPCALVSLSGLIGSRIYHRHQEKLFLLPGNMTPSGRTYEVTWPRLTVTYTRPCWSTRLFLMAVDDFPSAESHQLCHVTVFLRLAKSQHRLLNSRKQHL